MSVNISVPAGEKAMFLVSPHRRDGPLLHLNNAATTAAQDWSAGATNRDQALTGAAVFGWRGINPVTVFEDPNVIKSGVFYKAPFASIGSGAIGPAAALHQTMYTEMDAQVGVPQAGACNVYTLSEASAPSRFGRGGEPQAYDCAGYGYGKSTHASLHGHTRIPRLLVPDSSSLFDLTSVGETHQQMGASPSAIQAYRVVGAPDEDWAHFGLLDRKSVV